jgi:hypothetical protein|tara:strand:- start:1186 stop:1356 length:171 start_codon:yes stop_codon:yes gene_type:complete
MDFIASFVNNGDVVAVIVAIALVLERIGKLIPDHQEGWLGIIRKLCKLGGLYTKNK